MSDALRAYLTANLKRCCEELLEWSETGVLSEGCVREAERFVPTYVDVHPLRYIENCVKDLALAYVKNHNTP